MAGRRALLSIATLVAIIGISNTAPAHAATAAPGDPQVSVQVGPAESESVDGGLCYPGPISTRQPRGFTFVRSGSTIQPLTVMWEMDIVWTDVIRTEQGSARFDAGSAQAFVFRVEPNDPSVVDATWSIRLLPGTGYEAQRGVDAASFAGLGPARRPEPGESCFLAEHHEEDVRLEVGQPMQALVSHGSYRRRLLDGSFPPGIGIQGSYVGGTPTKAGSWTAEVEICPGVRPDQATCGSTTYRFTVVHQRIEENRDDPVDGSTTTTTSADERLLGSGSDGSSSTTSTTAKGTVSVDDDDDDGSGGGNGAALAVGGLGLVALAGLAVVLLRRRNADGDGPKPVEL